MEVSEELRWDGSVSSTPYSADAALLQGYSTLDQWAKVLPRERRFTVIPRPQLRDSLVPFLRPLWLCWPTLPPD